jgi:hypothetical protein
LEIKTNKKPRKHIPLEERAKRLTNWDGKPYVITEEDREWLNLQPTGKELIKDN